MQDFVQEVPVGQMAQGTPFRCLPWPTPPPQFQLLGGGKGEVKPPKCPTRHPGLADIFYLFMNINRTSNIQIFMKFIYIYIYIDIHTHIYIYTLTYIYIGRDQVLRPVSIMEGGCMARYLPRKLDIGTHPFSEASRTPGCVLARPLQEIFATWMPA